MSTTLLLRYNIHKSKEQSLLSFFLHRLFPFILLSGSPGVFTSAGLGCAFCARGEELWGEGVYVKSACWSSWSQTVEGQGSDWNAEMCRPVEERERGKGSGMGPAACCRPQTLHFPVSHTDGSKLNLVLHCSPGSANGGNDSAALPSLSKAPRYPPWKTWLSRQSETLALQPTQRRADHCLPARPLQHFISIITRRVFKIESGTQLRALLVSGH